MIVATLGRMVGNLPRLLAAWMLVVTGGCAPRAPTDRVAPSGAIERPVADRALEDGGAHAAPMQTEARTTLRLELNKHHRLELEFRVRIVATAGAVAGDVIELPSPSCFAEAPAGDGGPAQPTRSFIDRQATSAGHGSRVDDLPCRRTVAAAADLHGTSPEDTPRDLVRAYPRATKTG